MRKYGVVTAKRPHTTLRHLLVHPQDKVELENKVNWCTRYHARTVALNILYIRETGRLLKTQLDEHRKDGDNMITIYKTWETRLMSNFNKSTITDHATTENDIIDWEEANIIDKESNRRTRQVKAAIWIRQT